MTKITKRYPRVMLTTACVPWTEDFKFAEKIFRKQMQLSVESGIKHTYIFGTAGEGYAMSTAQFKEIVSVFADTMKGPGLHPMVCVISTAMSEIIERVRLAHGLGIREFQIAMPPWGALTDREMLKFFHGVCDTFPDCTFLHYNIGRSGRVLGMKDYVVLAKEIPNLAAAKFTTKDTLVINDIMSTPCPIQFFLSDLGYAYASLIGECAYLAAITATNINVAKRYFEAGIARDAQTLVTIERELAAVRKKLIEVTGTGVMDGVYDKVGARIVVPEFPMRLLPPYESIPDERVDIYRAYLAEHFPHWLP